MEEEIDYKKLYEQQKDKLISLEKENIAFRTDPVKRGYFALSRLLNLQIDALNDFNLKSNIGGKKSDDATFERMQGIWSNLPSMITDLTELKITLKITSSDESQNQLRAIGTSPESIARSLNNTAGQIN